MKFAGLSEAGKTAKVKDKYSNFSELAKNEKNERDFLVRLCKRDSAILVIAPHGGGIEPGTSEIAEAIAENDCSFYAFEGMKTNGNRDLHVTSSRFDEPQCAALAALSELAIAIHGENSLDKVVFIGGLDLDTSRQIRASLRRRGFCVKTHLNPDLQGQDPANICNRTISGRGVQLELSKGLRRSFFRTLSKNGRQTRTGRFRDFIAGVRAVFE